MGPFPVDKAGLGGSGALPPDTVAAALRNGMSFYESLQAGACWVGRQAAGPPTRSCSVSNGVYSMDG